MYRRCPYLTTARRRSERLLWCGLALRSIALSAAFGLTLVTSLPVQAANFHCGAGNVPCLIAAITEANANGEKKNRILLDAGTYTLTAVDNSTDGANGLPSITSSLEITGAGAQTTIIEHAAGFPSLPGFRLMHVAATGDLTLEGLTLRGGFIDFLPGLTRQGAGLYNNGGTVMISNSVLNGNSAGPNSAGGGLYNVHGMVNLTNSILSNNTAFGGGGIWNTAGGSVTITRSTLANNFGVAIGGGILNETGGTVTITDSTIASNVTFDPGRGGGIDNFGTLTIVNTTLSGNHGDHGHGGGAIANASGTVSIINSTISGNSGLHGGILNDIGIVTLQNSILALNGLADCSAVTSLGNNVIGTTNRCAITLQHSDFTGDPGLAAFSDDGTPGNGHYPLLATSQAIDGGYEPACPKRDQLGKKRHHQCDIGAIEFTDPD